MQDFVGPLGKPTEFEGYKSACASSAAASAAQSRIRPQRRFKEAGVEVDVIVGFRNKDIVILEDEFKQACDQSVSS